MNAIPFEIDRYRGFAVVIGLPLRLAYRPGAPAARTIGQLRCHESGLKPI